MTSSEIAYLGLGSNLGDREARLAQARTFIEGSPDVQILKTSKIYETEPWPKHEVDQGDGGEKVKQKWHLNQVLQIKTTLRPQELLKVTQEIEKKMGKEKKSRWGSREIDIDILLYGDEIIDLPELKIPHPHMHERQFVLVPLLEIDPEMNDPKTGKMFRECLDEIDVRHAVVPWPNRANKGS